VRAGKLRHRLTIEKATRTRDAHGGETMTWRRVANRWGSIEPLSGREQLQAQQAQSRMTHRVTMRHMESMTPHHRIKARGRTFNVHEVGNVEERDRMTVCLCEEVVGV